MSQQDNGATAASTHTAQNGMTTASSEYAAYVASFNGTNTNPAVGQGRTNPSYAGYERTVTRE